MHGKPEQPIRVGISSCLMGAKVRFDGRHKRDRYITDVLGRYFQFVPMCPELEVGMGVPRESVQLCGAAAAPRMIGNETGTDWTKRMNAFAATRIARDDVTGLCGFILKKDSPSCGLKGVEVCVDKGLGARTGVGLFARRLRETYPHLPAEEEGRFNDFRLRENFIERVFAYHRLRRLFGERFNRGRVVTFHAANKYLILSHSTKHYQMMGRLVAAIKSYHPDEFRRRYEALYMEALGIKTTVRKHANVMHHVLGFLKTHLDAEDKEYIIGIIEDYRREIVPLIVPLTLLRHYAVRYGIEYIADQIYLNPHPKELMLRNHV